MLTGRTGLIVWLHHTKHVRALRKYGSIHYVSKKMRYAVLYCDSDCSELVIQRLNKQRFTKRVDLSHLQELKIQYNKKKDLHIAKEVEEEIIY